MKICLLGTNHTIIQIGIKERHGSNGGNEENLPITTDRLSLRCCLTAMEIGRSCFGISLVPRAFPTGVLRTEHFLHLEILEIVSRKEYRQERS